METLKCPACGGAVELFKGQSIGQCLYCGKKVSVPTIESKKIRWYNEANELRQNCEFERARSIYENLRMENEKEADAYWGILLCKYGIEYVTDPKTGKKIPTCHRADNRSILEDTDYKQAIKFATSSKKEIWEEEAKNLDQILNEVLIEARKQNDFDVFICYKETDQRGRRTEDSVLAYEVYNELERQGYKVFFAPKSIELGQAYEPVIFAALRSAKLMFAIGTKQEYMEATWVKNEWSRYLEFIHAGENKTLIVLYKHLNPAIDIPPDLKRLQAYNLETMGYIQDISDAVRKIIGRKENGKAEVYQVDTGAARSEAMRYVAQGDARFQEGDNAGAMEMYNNAIAVDHTCAQAWWGKLKVQTGNFKVGPWEPMYTPEVLESKAQVIKYASPAEVATYRKVLINYEKGVSNLVTPKYRAELEQHYTQEKNILSSGKRNMSENDLQKSMGEYEKIYKKIQNSTYEEGKADIREEYMDLVKYRTVFNNLWLTYRDWTYSKRTQSDTFYKKLDKLVTQENTLKSEIWKVEGGRTGIVSALIALIVAALTLLSNSNYNTTVGIAMLVELVCFGIDISVNRMSYSEDITRVIMFFLSPLLLLGAIVFGGAWLSAQFNVKIDGNFVYLIIGVPALIMAVELCLNIKRYRKERKLRVKQSELRQNIKQVQEEMKRNAVKSLDDVEKECIRAKKYFFNRDIICKLIDDLILKALGRYCYN